MPQINKQERNKLLTEVLGECWHEWSKENAFSQKVCQKCDCANWKFVEGGNIEVTSENNDFSEWEGFSKLKDWIDAQKWSRFFWFEFFGFLEYLDAPRLTPDHAQATSNALNPDSLADYIWKVFAEGRVWLRRPNRS